MLIREALQRLRLGLVDAEHRQEVRESECLSNAVLRLQKAERRAEPLRRLQALHELAKAIAVDVVHVGEVEQDLLVALVQELFDEARQQLIADAHREAALKIDDDHIAFLACFNVHGGIIYRVNLLLLFPDDFVTATRARVTGRRLDEVKRIGGDALRVGVLDGRIGSATVVGEGELEVCLDSEPPPPIPLTLLLALPRPKVLNRVIAGATSMGIKKIFLINAWRVEKSYWKSPKLLHLRDQAILGLEQARDTVMPRIETRRFFRPFVEEELKTNGSLALVAHPGSLEPCPRDVQQPVTLAIGPEGGFIAEEIASLERVGFRAVHFGPRILRVETAVAALVGRLF